MKNTVRPYHRDRQDRQTDRRTSGLAGGWAGGRAGGQAGRMQHPVIYFFQSLSSLATHQFPNQEDLLETEQARGTFPSLTYITGTAASQECQQTKDLFPCWVDGHPWRRYLQDVSAKLNQLQAKQPMSKCTTAHSSEKGSKDPCVLPQDMEDALATLSPWTMLFMPTKESDWDPLTATQMPAEEGRGQLSSETQYYF